ncbi:hypothetical protein ACS3UN_07340 [Oscillospiraceae bacterium LTW-04]|nr:hypothetical protein RBH76_03005 [Oscillospiraceae bacterium MB24-C1]
MIVLAIISTIIAGGIGAFLEPISFAVSLPIAVMGGFILKAIKDKNLKIATIQNEQTRQFKCR